MKIFIAYERKEPHLPVAVGDSLKELAKELGLPERKVQNIFYYKRYHGEYTREAYGKVDFYIERVEIDDD